MVLATERRRVDEALVVRGLLVFAALAAALALVAEADSAPTGPLSGVRQALSDIFSRVGLVPTALALALVATVLITKTPSGESAVDSDEPVPSDVDEPTLDVAGPAAPVEPHSDPPSDYEEAVAAMAAAVAAWSPPDGIDPDSEFAEILTREPPASPWRSG